MAARAVQISIDEELLRRIDRDPETRKRGRSAVVRSALELYLKARDRRRIDDATRAAYAGKGREMLAEIEDLVEAQAWAEE